LFHVSDGESTEGRVFREDFNAHRLGGNHSNEAGISGLDELGEFFELFSGTSVDLGLNFLELDGDVGGVAIEDGAVSVSDLTGVVQDDDLGKEVGAFLGGVVLGVTADVSSLDVLDGQVLYVETNVVTGLGLIEGLVMHLD